MTDEPKQDYLEILHQIHADVFLDRLRDYVAQDGDVPDKVASDLNDLAQRLLVQDASPSIDRKDIEKLLEDDAIRDQLKQSIRNLTTAREEPYQHPEAK